jgi:uncharacterized protein (TIGR00369 family)
MSFVQAYYPPELSRCYGCGRFNESGLHIETHWDGERGMATFRPRPAHIALPGVVYGGLIASLVDCHGIGTAAAAAAQAAGRALGDGFAPRFVTAALQVDFRRPTPTGVDLVLEARPVEIGARKVVVEVTVAAGGETTATGRVVAVLLPEEMEEGGEGGGAGHEGGPGRAPSGSSA